ncbi:30S ribosomal protein S5 [Thalictrum thalictroides]|uniref:30S ribosomal protein S5 n=1 Tax=Thalictrum thalictroides TaxID=46969 RepID=A0A7J6W2X3_THATH|nr:30S ribosomal protein S5 [Thalictrum thalictroides]
MASTITKSKGIWSRLLLNQTLKPSIKYSFNPSRKIATFHNSNTTNSHLIPSSFLNLRLFSQFTDKDIDKEVQELFKGLDKDIEKEKEEKRKAGIEDDLDDVDPVIRKMLKKLDKHDLRNTKLLDRDEEPTDSESETDDERFTPEGIEQRGELFEKKHKRFKELLDNFVHAETLDEAHKWMKIIDNFEQKHFGIPLEYRVIGEMLNRLKEATGKEKFMLQQKLNRAMRLVQLKQRYDPNNPDNYGVIEHEEDAELAADFEDEVGEKDEEGKLMQKDGLEDKDEDEDDFNEDKDDVLLEKLNDIDKKLEEKLAELDNTFGKKGRVLEEEIRDLAEERNELTEKKRRPLYRKGFDVKLIDVNRTCKVTKGGQVVSYSAMLACGNYNGVVGFAKAKAPSVPMALQKAHEKCFQNLHHVERHEEHTIAHAVQTKYKKTKVYLWPASTRTGMKASKTVMIILNLAGFKNIKTKVIGSRNPHNTVKALFKALHAVETPKDVQEKFGRTVVESYLL